MIDKILEVYPDFNFLKADGFDDCIIGVCFQNIDNPRLIYSVNGIICNLTNTGLSEADALEYYHYNIEGGYVGEQTPIWCYDNF